MNKLSSKLCLSSSLILKAFGISFLFSLNLIAQDTITVQTITLEDDFRSGVFEFPNDPGQTYEKILMRYQMRCHDNAVGNGNVGCREWDYSCNTFITDSTRLDSNQALHPNYVISNFSGDVFNYTSQPTYTYQQYQQYQIEYTNVISESLASIGAGSIPLQLAGPQTVARAQFLFTAAELMASGFSAGLISGLKIDVTQLGTGIDFLRIKLKPTSKIELNPVDPDLDGFTEVYFLNTAFTNIGNHSFNFYNNFDWDGSSNLIVEFSFTRDGTGMPLTINGHDAGFNAGVVAGVADNAVSFSGAGSIPIDVAPFANVSDEITVALWAKGDPDAMPANTYLFEAVDANNVRQINSHTPWSNGQVYWDCGNDGGGYDRINQPANESDYEGQWNHWAYTKNATTGQMNIYLNGNLWLSGTNKNKLIEAVTAMKLGSSKNNTGGYLGAMDNVQIWNAELDETTIQEWMRRPLDASHPYTSFLMYDYNMDEGTGSMINDASPNALAAMIDGSFVWEETRGKDLYKNFFATAERPNLTFVQGTYEADSTILFIVDGTLNAANQVIAYDVDGSDLITTDTFFAYPSGQSYVYDGSGVIVDSIEVPTEVSLTIDDLTYYSKFPSKYEILSLVTPYGNGLSLGANGKTFTFDVTDYGPILKGNRRLSVEMGGQNQEELDIQFMFITGTPPREVLDIQNIWPFRRGYYAPIQNDAVFEPRMLTLSNAGNAFKVRSSITGHGQNGEFVQRDHYMNVNGGANEFVYPVWKKCGDIPIYPQGGTWLFDRAGWCPGDPTTVHHLDISSFVNPGETVEFDYGVLGPNMDQANYLVSNQLVTYAAPSFTVDAAVVDVIRPSKKVEYERFNPACNLPVVKIQNTGANTLTSLDISYNVSGGDVLVYNWTGSLEIMETEEVTLPVDDVSFWESDMSEQIFEVTISQPNGGADQYANNNSITSAFNAVAVFEGNFRIKYNTNNRASENVMYVKDHAGNIVLERTNMTDNTDYEDELDLPPGCYTMEFNDSGDDGLYYWYWDLLNLNVGSGYLRIEKHLTGTIYLTEKFFEPEFGSFVRFEFVIAEIVDTEEPVSQPTLISLRPNPASTDMYVDLVGFEGRDLLLELFDTAGRRMEDKSLENNQDHNLQVQFDISTYPSGIYMLRIDDGEQVRYKKVVKE